MAAAENSINVPAICQAVPEKLAFPMTEHAITEDAELCIRIYSQNYKVAILDSYTLEESITYF